MDTTQYGAGPQNGAAGGDFLASLNFTMPGAHSSARPLNIDNQVERLKGLHRTALLAKHQGIAPDLAPSLVPMGGGAPMGGSIPLLPPGSTSPQDSLAPAHRPDMPIASSVSDPISQALNNNGSTGQAPGLPPLPPSIALDFPGLPDDFSDLFGELEVPTLEDLVKDIYNAEAEAFNHINSSGEGGNRVRDLVRANTLPLPDKALDPSTELPNFASFDGDILMNAPDVIFPAQLVRTGSGAKKRKSLDGLPPVVKPIKIQLPPQAPAQQPPAAPPPRQLQRAVLHSAAEDLQQWNSMVERAPVHPSRGQVAQNVVHDITLPINGSADVHMSDQALLDRVDIPFSAFAALAGAPLEDHQHSGGQAMKRIGLSSSASLPNRHWLSPAASIHAISASKPGDEEVLRWLLLGN